MADETHVWIAQCTHKEGGAANGRLCLRNGNPLKIRNRQDGNGMLGSVDYGSKSGAGLAHCSEGALVPKDLIYIGAWCVCYF